MSKYIDRKNIVEEIKNAAQLYKKHLVGKTFLYVFEGKFIEVIYPSTYKNTPTSEIYKSM